MAGFEVLVDDLVFPECPRWHDGQLWCTDMHDHRVFRADVDSGAVDTVTVVDDDVPAGIGWLADGRLLVVAQESQRVLRQDPDGVLRTHAALAGLASGSCNDMIVRSDGVAYVGDMGMRLHDPSAPRGPGRVLRVDPDGNAQVAADQLAAPNGMVLTPGEGELIVAESGGMCLTAFDVAADGALGGRRSVAALVPVDPAVPYAPPDGICLDAEGAVWVADPIGARVLRVRPGGEVTHSIAMPAGLSAYACVLAGPSRRRLVVCAAAGWTGEAVHQRSGRLLALGVDVEGAGAP